DPDAQVGSSWAKPGLGPTSYDAYLAAQRTYPAVEIPPAIAAKAEATFAGIAAQNGQGADSNRQGPRWQQFGPTENATEPGVLAFSGATNNTASRTTALAIDPNCGAGGRDICRVWIGASGGGVWRTDKALASSPDWKQLKPEQLDQNSVGVLTLDPSDKQG